MGTPSWRSRSARYSAVLPSIRCLPQASEDIETTYHHRNTPICDIVARHAEDSNKKQTGALLDVKKLASFTLEFDRQLQGGRLF